MLHKKFNFWFAPWLLVIHSQTKYRVALKIDTILMTHKLKLKKMKQ